jgi:2-methylcitrate dehydratase PrpD
VTELDALAATPTVALAEFAAGLAYGDIPDDVRHEVARSLADWLAVTLAGAAEPGSARLRAVTRRVAPVPRATVAGTAERTTVPYAALLNGYAGHVLDFDDTYNPARTTIHGSSVTWPVIFALSEDESIVDGRRAVAAYVAGFETTARVAAAAGPTHYEAGWHVTGTAGHVGAAATAARVLGLDAVPTVHALGTGATQAAGLKELYGSDGKALHPAKAAMDGLVSALLAQEGFTATATSLEGERGFLRVLSPDPDPAWLTEGLGSSWHLPTNGYKAYASGSLTHPAVDAVLAIHARNDFAPDDVVRIVATVHPYAATVTGNPAPATKTQAKFSLQHCVAVAVHAGRLTPADFESDVVDDPAVVRLRGLVEPVVDQGSGKRAATVEVVLADGQVLRESVRDNRGTPDNPMTDDELERKLLDVAVPVLGAGRATELAALAWRVAELDDVAALIAATATPE